MSTDVSNPALPSSFPDALLHLVERCPDCQGSARLLKQLEQLMKEGTLCGRALIRKGEDTRYECAASLDQLVFHCRRCKGTGWALTQKGRMFLWFLSEMLPHVDWRWRSGDEEIPF